MALGAHLAFILAFVLYLTRLRRLSAYNSNSLPGNARKKISTNSSSEMNRNDSLGLLKAISILRVYAVADFRLNGRYDPENSRDTPRPIERVVHIGQSAKQNFSVSSAFSEAARATHYQKESARNWPARF